MGASRMFPLGAVLSVTTECFVCREGFGQVHELLQFMAGEPIWTHQLPRVNGECQPRLLAQHPQLAAIEVPTFEGTADEMKAAVFAWLDRIEAKYGTELEVAPLADGDHTSIDPLSELGLMGVPAEKVIVVDPEAGA